MMNNHREYLRLLPLWAALLPTLTFNVCYLIAMTLEHVPTCFPYIDGCTSVSSTGRALPESLFFKTGMLASAVVLALMWLRTASFLKMGGQSSLRVNALRVFAIIAAVSLVPYAMTLGLREEPYPFLRRVGINGFAIGNTMAQITFVVAYRSLRTEATKNLFRWLVVLCILLLLIGIASEVGKGIGLPRRPANNITAWNAFLVVAAYYLVVARIWWHHKIAAGRPASPSE